MKGTEGTRMRKLLLIANKPLRDKGCFETMVLMKFRILLLPVALSSVALLTAPCRADGPPWPPRGGFTEWGGIFLPGVSVTPANGCFHGGPLTFTANAAGGRKGIYDWRCGNHSQTTTNGTAQIPADHKGKPKTLTVIFTPDDYPEASASGSASLGYCKRFDPPPEAGEEEEEEHDDCNHHTHWWCCKCGTYNIPDPGSCPHNCSLDTEGGEDPGGGTNAPPQDITSYLGTVPREYTYTHTNAHAFVMFFPARRWANSGGNGGYGGTNAPPYACGGEGCGGIHAHDCCDHHHGDNTPDYGQCCPCHEHNPGNDGGNGTNSPLSFHSAHGVLVTTNPPPGSCAPLPPGAEIPDGTPVWVTGLNASQTLGDCWARFAWDEDGKTYTRDYTFTAIGMRLFPDRVGNGDPQANANLDLCYKTPSAEWTLPAGGGPCPMFLTTYTMLPGILTFTLDGTPGAFRVWSGSTTNSTLLFECPGTATNGNPHTITTQLGAVWVEAVTVGSATFTARFQGTGVASNYNVVRSFPIRAETRIRADANRDGAASEADDPCNLWSIERGALFPPSWHLLPPECAKRTAPLTVDTRGWTNGTTFALTVDDPSNIRILVYDAAGNQINWNINGHLPLNAGVFTNLYVASYHSRKCESSNFGQPDAFNLHLMVTPPQSAALKWGTVRLKIAPLILPPECNPAEAVYSTWDIPGITNLIVLTGSGACQWTQDMVKFTKVQYAAAWNTNVVLGLARSESGSAVELIADTPMMRAQWGVGGEGGNMMATPPLGTNAPYGKIMLGTGRPASKNYWENQGIQPIIDIDTSWLVVGHVDELFMWVAPDKVLFADPWKAADLLHDEIITGSDMNTIWCGWTTFGTNMNVRSVVWDWKGIYWKTNTLPVALDGTAADVTVTFPSAVFETNDYLRVGKETLRVASVNGDTYVLERGKGRPVITTHASNDFIYALSPLMVKNLIDTNGIPSVVSRIALPLNQLKAGLGNYASNVQFVSMPVLFDDGVIANGITHPQGVFSAATANLVNCLMKKPNEIYYSDPGIEVFRNYFRTNVASGAVAVDVWNVYHCNYGEIHCGTAARRILQHEPPWWEQNEVKTKWEDEQ